MRLAHPGLKNPEYNVRGLPVDDVAQRYGISPSEISELGSAETFSIADVDVKFAAVTDGLPPDAAAHLRAATTGKARDVRRALDASSAAAARRPCDTEPRSE